MVDFPRHFVEIQHHLNKMHKPYEVYPFRYPDTGSDQPSHSILFEVLRSNRTLQVTTQLPQRRSARTEIQEEKLFLYQ